MRLANSTDVKQCDNKPPVDVRGGPRAVALAIACASAVVGLGGAPSVLASAAAGNAASTGRSSGEVPIAAPVGVQSLAAIARRAEDAVRAALPHSPPTGPSAAPAAPTASHRITAREPDPRLRLPACPSSLEATLPVSVGGLRARTVVQVACKAPSSRWTVLVPVALETDSPVLVAARGLSRGQVPRPGDVQVMTRTLPGISTLYISNLNEIHAQHLIRPVEAGQPLTRDALAADPVVRRGEAVTLIADLGGVEVRMPGRALADAQPGQPVRVQNVNSLKIVEGRADDEGMVRVDR